MKSVVTITDHLKATALVLLIISICAVIAFIFCSSTPITTTTTEYSSKCSYPDSITLRIEDFKYYWVDDVRNEYNHEWIVETAFNNNVDYKHVTQAMFNKRYGLHTIAYNLKHKISTHYEQH